MRSWPRRFRRFGGRIRSNVNLGRHSVGMVGMVALLAAPACPGCETRPRSEAVAPVATCITTQGDVRRRLFASSAWRSLSAGNALFAGDWVQTAERATADVEYAEGPSLRVQPGSTVVIQPPSDGSQPELERIEVVRGTVEGRLSRRGQGRALRVALPAGKTVELSAPSETSDVGYRVQVEASGRTDVVVTEGEAEIRSPDGQVQQLEPGTAVRLQTDGSAERQSVPPAPSTVSVDAEATYPGESVLLRWSGASGVGYRVEVAADPGFSQRLAVLTSRDNQVQYQPESAGPVFFRVYSQDDGLLSLPSETARLVVNEDTRPRDLRSPENGTRFETPGRTARVRFAWEESQGPYTLRVSRNEDLSKPQVRRSVDGTETTLRLPPGTYHWGVFGPGQTLRFVDPFQFEVRQDLEELQVPARLRWPGGSSDR